jgi:TM2 domain-containing membrane protein YozV/predicted RNA-binding Zn-ribbon protein involved in translation (DUF1610 family)
MHDPAEHPAGSDAVTVYCTQCGQAMLVAREHVSVAVACPHCGATVEAWRVARTAPATPPRRIGYAPRQIGGLSSRSRVVAGVLGILLGPIGVHRFYLGYIGVGVLQIILTCCTSGLAGLWGFIEGILCLTGQTLTHDADGFPLRD